MRRFPVGTAFLSLVFQTFQGAVALFIARWKARTDCATRVVRQRQIVNAVRRAAFATLILLLFVRWPLAGQEAPVGARDGEHRILFRTNNGVVYIPARVNGSKTTLLIDTGATLSTFNMKIVSATRNDARMTMNLATGSVPAFLVPAGFILGDSDAKEQRCRFRRMVVTGDFKFGEADGVIGIDVLSSFKAVTFDFQHSILILEDR